ncbi:uncharacterized protein TNCV_4262381 [Trichonephila clavipes]|nr:uncharacterized protein TNCV_4262381 [Trichonephila clavipes]
MATGSYLTPIYSRSQSEVLGDHHKVRGSNPRLGIVDSAFHPFSGSINEHQLEVSEVLGIAQSVISRLWQRFQDDGNVSRCYSTGDPRVTTPKENWYIWQLLPKETDGAQHQTCLVSSL